MRMLLGSMVNRGLLSPPPSPIFRREFLSIGTLAFLGTSMLSAQILVVRMKLVAFRNASARVASFCSAKENLNCPLFRPLRNEVYATRLPNQESRPPPDGSARQNSPRILAALA